jgi:hypothetical protein
MEKSEVSIHEARFFHAVMRAGQTWTTSQELAVASGIAKRTGRHFTRKLCNLGILDVAEVFPAHRYRLSEMAAKRNRSYMQRLEQAAEVFQVAPP